MMVYRETGEEVRKVIRWLLLLCLFLLSGCATTAMKNPDTGHTQICSYDWTTWPTGQVMYNQCIDALKQAGYKPVN